MSRDELKIYELISEKGDVLTAVDVLLSNPEDKSYELLYFLQKEKDCLIQFILDLFALKRSLTKL
jgi:hypothetical protein